MVTSVPASLSAISSAVVIIYALVYLLAAYLQIGWVDGLLTLTLFVSGIWLAATAISNEFRYPIAGVIGVPYLPVAMAATWGAGYLVALITDYVDFHVAFVPLFLSLLIILLRRS